ncbi:MAG: hypothetical protein LBU70_10900 [Chitinispirillales bacterium]|jgi:hypothetical protein|nr:hypothetical protein [Chitinispirillales bacterium]
MKKVLFLLSVLILLTFVVANCDDNTVMGGENNDNGSLKLDPVIETQIKQDWLEQFGSSLSTVNYYGTHNGYVAFFLPGADAVVVTVEIAGTIFRYGSDGTIYLWRDGSFYDMIDAYEQGLVNSENISELAEIHKIITGWE